MREQSRYDDRSGGLLVEIKKSERSVNTYISVNPF
jgi:hypothetical protein